MIDHEEEVFEAVSTALRNAFDGIYVIGVELSDVPPQFPAVSFVLKNNEVNQRGSTFESVQNVASEEYETQIYSNLESSKKAKEETKEILAVIDGVMSDLFYIRSFSQPVPNADSKYTRRVARYRNTNIV